MSKTNQDRGRITKRREIKDDLEERLKALNEVSKKSVEEKKNVAKRSFSVLDNKELQKKIIEEQKKIDKPVSIDDFFDERDKITKRTTSKAERDQAKERVQDDIKKSLKEKQDEIKRQRGKEGNTKNRDILNELLDIQSSMFYYAYMADPDEAEKYKDKYKALLDSLEKDKEFRKEVGGGLKMRSEEINKGWKRADADRQKRLKDEAEEAERNKQKESFEEFVPATTEVQESKKSKSNIKGAVERFKNFQATISQPLSGEAESKSEFKKPTKKNMKDMNPKQNKTIPKDKLNTKVETPAPTKAFDDEEDKRKKRFSLFSSKKITFRRPEDIAKKSRALIF